VIRTQIQLTESQMAALRRLADARGTSLAQLIRMAVDELVARGPDHAEQTRARALAIVGQFTSGCRDVSRHHDRYLAEAIKE
jgi:hypothetical protein